MRQTLKRVGVGLASVVVLLLLWGVLIEPRWLDPEEHSALVPGLPDGWEGRRIAVVADFQVGVWWANTGTMQRHRAPRRGKTGGGAARGRLRLQARRRSC